MSLSKAQIFNLALGALLLSRRITDTDTDRSNENTVLNTHWETAFNSALADMDLDSTATSTVLALVDDFTDDADALWDYSYTYPSDCVLLRRIKSSVRTDDRFTHISKQVALVDGDKVILTDEVEASAEYVTSDVSIASLTNEAGLAIAYRLAALSAPLATGKGAKLLIQAIEQKFVVAKAEAQRKDKLESFSFVDEATESEFVKARLE